MNIGDALKEVARYLDQAGITEARHDAALLVGIAVGRDKTFLIAHPEYELDPIEIGRLKDLTARRGRREPYQYINGKQEFFGLEFEVTPAVLIPRPETEILVEHAIKILNHQKAATQLIEIGTGSGCIAVSILYNTPKATAVAGDISTAALDVAKRNAEKHKVSDRISLLESNVYASMPNALADLIVSNPPYVPSAEMALLQPEVRDFEPHSALTDGHDGLSIIREIIDRAPDFLKTDGQLLLEIGYDQSRRVLQMFDRNVWHEPKLFDDLQGIPRIVNAARRVRAGSKPA